MGLRFAVMLLTLLTAPLCVADTFKLSFSGSGETGSVLLSSSSTSTAGHFLVTGASGSIDDEAVSLLAPNTYPSVGPNDNLLSYSAATGQASFDVNGVSFLLASGTDYNLYQQAGQYFATVGPQRAVSDITTLVITPAASTTPEPASLALFATGLCTLAASMRRRSAGITSL